MPELSDLQDEILKPNKDLIDFYTHWCDIYYI